MKKQSFFLSVIYIITTIAALMVILPLLLLIMNSLKDPTEFYLNPLGFPSNIRLQNFIEAYTKARMNYAIPNSLILVLFCEVFLVALGLTAAFPMARIRLRLNRIVLSVFFAGMIIPPQVIAIPLFVQMRNMGLINTVLGLSLVLTASQLPLAIFIYSGFIKTIPYEIDEAAVIDGCSPVQVFMRMIVPLSNTATVTVVLLTTLHVWREFFYPLVLTTKVQARTLSVALFSFQNFETVEWTSLFAAMVIMMVPVVIIFLFGQRYIISGSVSGAVKG
jgi:raffinose/stachyose/melibiose transport system permease protein